MHTFMHAHMHIFIHACMDEYLYMRARTYQAYGQVLAVEIGGPVPEPDGD
jgi:hypothetical protein